jgi:DNA primase
MDAALRRLEAEGVSAEDLRRVEREAGRAGVAAPFLKATGERARELWREAFNLLMELESLERAVEAAVSDLGRDPSAYPAMAALKADRDHLRRLINTDWANGEDAKPVLPH